MSKSSSPGSRVLMLLENAPYLRDGRVRHEANTLVAAGYQVTVICPAFDDEPRSEIVDDVQIYRFPGIEAGGGIFGYMVEYGQALLMMFAWSLWVWVRRGFDVLHTHNPPDTLSLIAAFYKLWGKKFVYDHHDLSPDLYRIRFDDRGRGVVYNVLMFFERFSCHLADHIIATNESYQAVEIERGGASEEDITIVRNGPYLQEIETTKPEITLRNGTNHVLGYAGIIGYQDGLDYLIRALVHLTDTLGRHDFRCVICGTGDALSMVQALVSEHRLEHYVRFAGWLSRSELVSYLLAADICVAPEPSNLYNDRSTMIKLMEYMMLGKPIVAFDLPEHRVTAENAALYAKPNDELDFAKKVTTLMDDPDLCVRLGQFGKQRVETELAWPYQAEKLLEVYRSLQGV
ncbi:MAG: glycosyltransferase family 4 protein [Anaerolineae bacterium]|nr:glycosyltransferase family 4 protein [Anaerolineae bacterium]